ncbi:MAG: endonuclease [Bacteroidaceae bacterium]|nr:endonuclease [Bacteroidaceae bacterium]
MRTVISVVCLLIAGIAVADMPRDYYPDNIAGRNKGDLKTELHKLLKEHRRIEYGGKGTWVVFRESDRRDNGTVWDMYSNVVRYFQSSGATPGMNIEHSVPKSWWGDDYPYTVDGSFDLHHLVPADADANSAKSNYIIGEVTGTVKFDNGVSKVGYNDQKRLNVFEPADEYKGDFARMYMYFVTCYQDYVWRSNGTNMFITGSYPTLNDYSQELLLKWHRQDPVSKKELDRNNAVYSFQYNRNPFIDYPQIAEYIWGDSTEYVFNFDGSAVVAPSISVKSGDIISFNGVLTNEVTTMQYRIKGSNIKSSLYLRVDDTQNFEINRSSIPASELTSAQGAVIEITYHPQSQGLHRAVLEIACDDLPDDIEVVLQGVCMPDVPNFVMIEGLRSQYSRQEADVVLNLKNYTDPVTWYVNDKPLGGNIFSPSALAPGRYKISFKNDDIRGEVRVTIIE